MLYCWELVSHNNVSGFLLIIDTDHVFVLLISSNGASIAGLLNLDTPLLVEPKPCDYVFKMTADWSS
mgnify:CR=1 FL=1